MNDQQEDRRALELFERLLDLQASERDEWLREQCQGNAGLFERVRRLVAADDEASGWDLTGGAANSIARELPRQIGPYRVEGPLGEGGMGTVLKAERVDGGFEQSVAIKLLHLPGHHPAFTSFVARFHAERAILANLNHPNIAHLYDGGALDDGTPYIVMERVDGVPITDFAASLDLVDVLHLFIGVCDAVQAAHQQLVVHRDIKPSNILVQADGVPKLLDFGIAKVLGDDAPELTRAGAASGLTAQYAAPEQIAKGTVTTASDVYSLGVLLFELVTGARPYDLSKSTDFEAARMVVEDAPMSVTAALQASGSSRRVGRDLESIIGKAMQKDPARRYASASEFADDLSALMTHRPVRARPDRWHYVAGKFVARNRYFVAAGLAAVASLVIGLLVALHQSSLARDEARRAMEVTEFLGEVLMAPSAWGGTSIRVDPDASIADMVDAAAGRVEAAFPGRYEVQAQLFATLAMSYRALGNWERAYLLSDKALDLVRTRVRPDSALQSRVRREYTIIRAHSPQNDIGQIVALLEEAEHFARKHQGVPSVEHAWVLAMLGQTYRQLEDRERALVSAHDEWLAAGGDPGHDLVAGIVYKIGQFRQGQGRYEAAEARFVRAIEIYEAKGQGGIVELAFAYEVLGSVRSHLGRFDEARADINKAMAILENATQRNPWVVVTRSYLAELARLEGDLTTAKSELTTAWRIADELELAPAAPHRMLLALQQAELDLLQEDYVAVVAKLSQRVQDPPALPVMAIYHAIAKHLIAIGHAGLGEDALAEEIGREAYRELLEHGGRSELLDTRLRRMQQAGIDVGP